MCGVFFDALFDWLYLTEEKKNWDRGSWPELTNEWESWGIIPFVSDNGRNVRKFSQNNLCSHCMCLWWCYCVVLCRIMFFNLHAICDFLLLFCLYLHDSVSSHFEVVNTLHSALIPSIFLLFFNLFVCVRVCLFVVWYVFARCSFICNLFLSSYLCFVARSWFWLLRSTSNLSFQRHLFLASAAH